MIGGLQVFFAYGVEHAVLQNHGRYGQNNLKNNHNYLAVQSVALGLKFSGNTALPDLSGVTF
jgi:hypothetical protein